MRILVSNIGRRCACISLTVVSESVVLGSYFVASTPAILSSGLYVLRISLMMLTMRPAIIQTLRETEAVSYKEMSDPRRIGIDNDIKGNRGITLWIKVDGEHFVLFEHESTGEVHRRRRLPYSTFVVRNSNNTCQARGKDLCNFRGLPCCHASHPCEVELLNLSMIKPHKENYNGCSMEA